MDVDARSGPAEGLCSGAHVSVAANIMRAHLLWRPKVPSVCCSRPSSDALE